MALDEALLEAAEAEGVATLRFYAWREPTLSLGYFQSHSDRQGHLASLSCALVRRASGGGAIMHDRELTYSVAMPMAGRDSGRAEWLYDVAHDSLVETLAGFGIVARRWANDSTSQNGAAQPFLCFQRRAKGDVLIGDWKVCGSAQRRHRNAVLQHGSVILKQSDHAPELPGVTELSGRPLDIDTLREAWLPRFAERLGLVLESSSICDSIRTAAAAISARKFANQVWTERR